MFLHLDSRSTSGSADKLGSAHKRCFVVTELQGPSKGPGLLGVINCKNIPPNQAVLSRQNSHVVNLN